MNVKDRIKAFCKSENITISAFESEIGVANGYVNSISKSIGIDKIEIILEKFPNINLEWLLAGKGTMYKTQTPPFPAGTDSNSISIEERKIDILESMSQDLKEIKIHLFRLRNEQAAREDNKNKGNMCG